MKPGVYTSIAASSLYAPRIAAPGGRIEEPAQNAAVLNVGRFCAGIVVVRFTRDARRARLASMRVEILPDQRINID
jgi:hypothetical protein